jgi:hypothetical protein
MGQVGGGANGTVDTKTRTSHISWIPFNKMPEMYKTLETIMKKLMVIILVLKECK